MSSKHPRPALPSSKPSANRFKQITWLQSTQNKHRPVPANHTCLRLGGAVTSCTYGHGYASTFTGTVTHARIFTAMFIPLRVMCTATSTSGHASDETSVRLEHIKRQSNSLKFPAAASHLRGSTRPTRPLKSPGGTGTASPRDAATAGAPRSSPPEGRRLRPRAWIPEESGQAGFNKSPQARRRGNRIRRTNDRSRRPSARPGVTHAPRRRGAVSLPFRVSLAAFC